jgi:hypothetical protein
MYTVPMPSTYKAILKGDRVEWIGEAPETNGGIAVEITLIEEPPAEASTRGPAMAAALQKIADAGGVPGIPDPVAWQREIRRDRPLPGRDDSAAAAG